MAGADKSAARRDKALSRDDMGLAKASPDNQALDSKLEEMNKVRGEMKRLAEKHFAESLERKGERELRTERFDDYMRTCINHHISCGIGVCPKGYAHATDCGYVIDSYIATHKFKRQQRYDSEVWLPGVGQIALFTVYDDKNKFIHKLGIHHVEEGKYRIVQGMRARFDAFTTLTHRPTYTYPGMDQAQLDAFFAHQRRYGLPYNLHGYSTKEEAKRMCVDIQLCAEKKADPMLVFGGYTPGRVTTTLYGAPPSSAPRK